MKYRILFHGYQGPSYYERQTKTEMLGLLMILFTTNCSKENASMWEKKLGKWVPMFPWQLMG